MNNDHLTDTELDQVLIGEGLDPDRALHLGSCVACRRRRDTFLSLVEEVRLADPDPVTREESRAAALAAWGAGRPRPHQWRWWAAAAAVLLVMLLPLWTGDRQSSGPQPTFNAEAVLAEVDHVLQSDPLTTFASEDVVEVMIPVESVSWEGGA